MVRGRVTVVRDEDGLPYAIMRGTKEDVTALTALATAPTVSYFPPGWFTEEPPGPDRTLSGVCGG